LSLWDAAPSSTFGAEPGAIADENAGDRATPRIVLVTSAI